MSVQSVRAIAAIVIAQALFACASTPAPKLMPACRSHEVLYCADKSMCSCLTQGAAKATVDSL
jgi:hypothetical protein